jgi:predicted acylesterase/phospholipase RssA
VSRFRMLAIDGGGIRGLIPALWLNALEQKLTPTTMADAFDLFAGTSTGAIIAAGLAVGAKTTAEIGKLYSEHASEVFLPAPSLQRWSRISPWLRPGYVPSGLNKLLRTIFEDRTLRDVHLRSKVLLVTAFDAFNREPVVFDSSQAEDQELSLVDVCLASSAAPTYFPAHVMKYRGGRTAMLDGGMTANNPAAIALACALRDNRPREDVLLISLGTGQVTENIPVKDALRFGRLQWSRPVIDVLFEGNSGITADIVEQVMHPRGRAPQRDNCRNYFRLQVRLEARNGNMDDVREANLQELTAAAAGYLVRLGREKFEAAVAALSRPRRAGARVPNPQDDADPRELVRTVRDRLPAEVRKCIEYAAGDDWPEVLLAYLQSAADGVPEEHCVRQAREQLQHGGVPFHQCADLLRTSQARFNAELLRRFTALREETQLLMEAIERESRQSSRPRGG